MLRKIIPSIIVSACLTTFSLGASLDIEGSSKGIDYLKELNAERNMNEAKNIVNNVEKLVSLQISNDGAQPKIEGGKLILQSILDTYPGDKSFWEKNKFGIILPTFYGNESNQENITYSLIYEDSLGSSTEFPTGIKVSNLFSNLITLNKNNEKVINKNFIENLKSNNIIIDIPELLNNKLVFIKNFSSGTLKQLILINETLKGNSNARIGDYDSFLNSNLGAMTILYVPNGENFNIYKGSTNSGNNKIEFLGSSKVDTVVEDKGALDLLTKDVDSSLNLIVSNNEMVTVLNDTTENIAVQYQRIDTNNMQKWIHDVKVYNNAKVYNNCNDMYNSEDKFGSYGNIIFEKATYHGDICYININTNQIITKQSCEVISTATLPNEYNCVDAVYDACGLVITPKNGKTAREIAAAWDEVPGTKISIDGKCFIKKGN